MSGIIATLVDSYREQIERHRNRPFLRAAMASCALATMSNGVVSLRERVRVDQVLATLDALQVFDPHEGVELFNEFIEAFRASEEDGRRLALTAIEDEAAQEPGKAELLIRISVAVCAGKEGVSEEFRQQIAALCDRLGVARDLCLELELEL
jgi:tellurite resistance protein